MYGHTALKGLKMITLYNLTLNQLDSISDLLLIICIWYILESAEQKVDGSGGTDETCGDNNFNQTTYNMPGNLSFIIKIAILFGG